MDKSLDRRDFIIATAALGASFTLGGLIETVGAAFAGPPPPDLAVVEGSNYYDAARTAVETLGGMSRFVSKGSM